MKTWQLAPTPFATRRAYSRVLSSKPCFRRNINNPRSVMAEWIQRNNKIGLQEIVAVHLTTWTNVCLDDKTKEDVELDAYIGLSDSHQLVSVVHVGERRFARSLSGKRKIGAYFVTEHGEIYAVDKSGRLLRFESDKWNTSPLLPLAKRAIRHSVLTASLLTMAAVGLSEAIVDPDMLARHWSATVALPAAFASVGGAAIHAWLASLRFESQNRNADGMNESTIELDELREVRPVVDENHSISDYRLVTSTGQHSLSQLAHLDREHIAKSHLKNFNAGREDLLRSPLPPAAVFTQD